MNSSSSYNTKFSVRSQQRIHGSDDICNTSSRTSNKHSNAVANEVSFALPMCFEIFPLIDSRDFNNSIMNRSGEEINLMFPTSEKFSTSYGSAEFWVYEFQVQSKRYGLGFGLEVYGYCNGVFVLLLDRCKPALWNPSTRQLRILPCFPFDPKLFDEYFDFGVGFGYDSSRDEYKVVVVEPYSHQFPPEIVEYRVWVFGLRENSWRKAFIDSKVRVDACTSGFRFGCFAHGDLYWLCNSEDVGQQIVAFDLAKETLSTMATPDYNPIGDIDTNLHVAGGCLFMSFFTTLTHPMPTEARLYVRKKVDEAEYAWTLLYSVTTDQSPPFLNMDGFFWMEVLGYSKEGDKIMLDLHSDCVVSYDIKRKRFQLSDISISPTDLDYPARSFVESLVSLHARDRTIP